MGARTVRQLFTSCLFLILILNLAACGSRGGELVAAGDPAASPTPGQPEDGQLNADGVPAGNDDAGNDDAGNDDAGNDDGENAAAVPPAKGVDPLINVPEACQSYARSKCELQHSCHPELSPLPPPDRERCERTEMSRCTAHLGFAGSTFTVEALAQCEQDMRAADCARLRGGYVNVESCLTGPGSLAAGVPCYHDHQCQSGLCYDGSSQGCEACAEDAGGRAPPWDQATGIENVGDPPSDDGRCKNRLLRNVDGSCQPFPGQEGDPCDDGCDALAGLACELSPTEPSVCTAGRLLSVGSPCGGESRGFCEPGTGCYSLSDLGTGNCKAFLLEGETCSELEFTSHWCDFGLKCDDELGMCVPSTSVIQPPSPEALGCGR